MEVYYLNHKNEKIDLGRPPYQMQIADLFNYAHRYEGSNNKISRIYRDITEISAIISFEAETEAEFCECVNHFYEVVEADTAANVTGRLYIGEYYLACNIVSSKKSFWTDLYNGMDNRVSLLTPYPLWRRETRKVFYKNNAAATFSLRGVYLQYPFGYPYKYSAPANIAYMQNEHYGPCGFKMVIYGPCVDPAIRINGHLHEVITTLADGEYIVVDTKDNSIKKYATDGTASDLFNARNKQSEIFEKIPAGNLAISWNLSFGFDITLYQERSEPRWIL